jgi:hypothetical protein
MNLFGISRGKWHSTMDGWWCLLSFSPEILLHPGVFFATTNNIYTSVQRKMGAQGLNDLFADRIQRWPGYFEYVPTQSTMWIDQAKKEEMGY